MQVVAGIYRNLFELVVPTITTLDFSGLGWGVQEALILARAIPEMGSLTSLDLSSNQLCGMSYNVRTYNWEGTYTAEGIIAIAVALKGNGSLNKLDARANGLRSDEGKAALQDAVRSKEGFELLI